MKLPTPALFFMAALAIVPIAAQIVSATEQLAVRTGDAIGGLLNDKTAFNLLILTVYPSVGPKLISPSVTN